MNDIKHIDEAIYQLGQDKVVKKKNSILTAVIILCQVFRYVPHNYEPECEMLIFEK